jgi:hypothetical protein
MPLRPNEEWLRKVKDAEQHNAPPIVWLVFAPHGGGKLTFADDLHTVFGEDAVAVWGGKKAPTDARSTWFRSAGALARDEMSFIDINAEEDDW